MIQEKNVFGEGELYEADDLDGKIYVICCACMSIYSEFLSWANKYPDRMTNDPFKAKNIIILSCQVTDLSILNDLNTLESLKRLFKDFTNSFDEADYLILLDIFKVKGRDNKLSQNINSEKLSESIKKRKISPKFLKVIKGDIDSHQRRIQESLEMAREF